MKIFIDEYGKIFCEFRKGIYSLIDNEYFKKLKKADLIKEIEFCVGD